MQKNDRFYHNLSFFCTTLGSIISAVIVEDCAKTHEQKNHASMAPQTQYKERVKTMRKQRNGRRAISLLLALVLAFSLLPVSVFAAGDIAVVNGKAYTSVKDAWNAVKKAVPLICWQIGI